MFRVDTRCVRDEISQRIFLFIKLYKPGNKKRKLIFKDLSNFHSDSIFNQHIHKLAIHSLKTPNINFSQIPKKLEACLLSD
jgi:hypothetical protein